MRPTHVRTTILAAALLLLLAACGDDTTAPGPAKAPDQLAGRVFVGEDVTGHPLVSGSVLRLDFTDGMKANAGCNHLGGEGSLDDGFLVATVSAMTEMGCEQPRMEQDTWFVSFLESRPAATVEGPVLTLDKDGVTIRLTDEEHIRAQNPIPLEGTTWELESLVQGDAASSVPGDKQPTIELEGGKARVFTGCNRGSGQVSVGDTTMTFGPLALTKMACQDSPEAAVLAVLTGEVAFAHDHDQLTLTGFDGKALVFHARRYDR